MYRDLSIAVVIPAFNEARAIDRAIRRVPAFADDILVIDDASRDDTAVIAARSSRPVEIVRHGENRGVGAAIVTGYRRVVARGIDVAVVMAGDGQMDPDDLPALLDPLAEGRADYTKGNRFLHPDIWRAMPATRLLGNVLLSFATRISSGYRRVFDSQCGYTAITRRALERLDLDAVFPRYGYPNDLLARLHAAGVAVQDVPVKPVYGAEWKSGIKPHTVVYPISFVLLRSWTTRRAAERRVGTPRTLPHPGGSGAAPGGLGVSPTHYGAARGLPGAAPG